MHVDESLAKGLKRQFWNFLAEENTRQLSRIRAVAFPPAGDLSNRKIAARFFKALDDVADSPVILHRDVTGKRNSSHWWSIHLDYDPEHCFNSWKEPALRVNVARVWARGQLWNPTWLTAMVGEHCITRMFQRLNWTCTPTPQSLLPELSELSRVLPWYIQAYWQIARKFEGRRLSVFIPTSHGVFLGISNPKDPELLELRTFVAKDQLRDNQLQLWSLLFNLSKSPPVSEYLGALLDPTRAEYHRTAKDWFDTLLGFMHLLLNHAHLLQDDLEALHPSLIREKFG